MKENKTLLAAALLVVFILGGMSGTWVGYWYTRHDQKQQYEDMLAMYKESVYNVCRSSSGLDATQSRFSCAWVKRLGS